jgi:oligoendopeptidase F
MAKRTNDGLGALPVWDLGDLFAGRDSAELEAALAAAASTAADFGKRHKGRLKGLTGRALGAAVAEYEAIEEAMARVMSYAQLLYAGNTGDAEVARFYQNTLETINAVSADLLFFALEINRLDDDALTRRLKSPALKRYAPWLREVRAHRPHQLAQKLETVLHQKAVVGRAAWTRLFDETQASLRVRIDGRALALEEAFDRLTDPKGAVRKQAAKALGRVFARNVRTLALITNTLAKDKAIEDDLRGYPEPAASRHVSNQVEGRVVEALVGAVVDAYPALSHRYYRLKARWLGKDKLEYWDRTAPLPGADERRYRWEEARDLVLDSYARFSPRMAEIGRRFFDSAWIDAPVRPGKAPGAFAHSTVPSVHPYLLLNYLGKPRDVMTLAHELGHGVHQVLAAPRGALMADTPLTLAETASVFGEQLTFRALLDAEADPARRRVLVALKVEDMLNTVVRQIAFYTFERALHDERRGGELLPERIGEIWLDIQRQSLGPAFHFAAEYRNYWCYIPHFIHAPFYVYAYAFGDCLVNALYAVYQRAPAGFEKKYLAMLRAGGTKRHGALLQPFGLDAGDPAFWSTGLGVIGGLIDELEAT